MRYEAWGMRGKLIPHAPCPMPHPSCLIPRASCLMPRASCLLRNEHTVPIRIEKVFLCDRFFICAANRGDAGEGGDEHDERRFRQMKIREQFVDRFEFEAR